MLFRGFSAIFMEIVHIFSTFAAVMKLRTLLYLLPSLAFIASGCSARSNASVNIGADSATVDSPAASGVPLKDTIRLSIAFVGDVMMGTTFPDSIHGSHLPANDGAHLFDDARHVTERVDLMGANLEGSFLEGPGKRRPMRNPKTYFIFRMPPKYVKNLVDAGFDFVGIANNHINDFGQPGRKSTVNTLREANLPVVGLKGICETAIIERKGLKIGVTQFGHGANNLDVNDLSELRRVVSGLKKQCDIVVVSFHGGAEGTAHMHVTGKPETYVGERRANVKEFARTAIDTGADIVFGHGPHVPRAAELYKGHIIFYSLGNFCTPYRMGIAGATGLAPIAEVVIDGNGNFTGGKIHSLRQVKGVGPRIDKSNEAARLIRRLSAEDFPESHLRIADDGTLSVDSNVAK